MGTSPILISDKRSQNAIRANKKAPVEAPFLHSFTVTALDFNALRLWIIHRLDGGFSLIAFTGDLNLELGFEKFSH